MPNPNVVFSGIRPWNARETDYLTMEVQSNPATDIYPGEPLHQQSDGSVLRQAAGTNTDAATDGISAICTEILEFVDTAGVRRRNAKFLPSGTTWTIDNNRARIQAILAKENMIFEAKANAAVASLAAARSLRGATLDHVFGTANQALGLSGVAMNISTAGTSANRQWKVVDVLDVVQNDPTQVSFTLLVIPNLMFLYASHGVGV